MFNRLLTTFSGSRFDFEVLDALRRCHEPYRVSGGFRIVDWPRKALGDL